MLFYFVFFAILLIIAFLFKERGNVLIVLLLVFLVCLRGPHVGTDTADYIYDISQGSYSFSINNILGYYQDDSVGTIQSNASTNSGREFVFAALVSFLTWLGLSPFFAMKLISVGIILMYYKALRIFLPRRYVVWGLILYVGSFLYFTHFNTLRQSLACSFIFLSAAFIYKGGKGSILKSVMLALCAVFSHTSSLVALLLIPLSFIRVAAEKRFLFISIVLFLLLCVEFLDNQMGLLNGLFDWMLSLELLYSNQIENYSMNDITMSSIEKNLTLVFHILIVITFIWCLKVEKDRRYTIVENIWFLGLALFLLLSKSPIFARISEFFLSFQFVALPITVMIAQRGKKYTTLGRFLIVLYVFISYWFYLQAHWYGVIPYELFF